MRPNTASRGWRHVDDGLKVWLGYQTVHMAGWPQDPGARRGNPNGSSVATGGRMAVMWARGDRHSGIRLPRSFGEMV
jgi:hypothetical protein